MRHFLKSNQDGSVMVIALMVMAIMTVIALMSADTTVTENFIIRNVGIYKQNVNVAETAVMEGLQQVMQLRVPNETNAQLSEMNAGTGSGDDVSLWLNSDNIWAANNLDAQWYSTTTGRVLDPAATSPALNLKVPTSGTQSPVLAERGETASGNLQMALVGWQPATSTGNTSLKATMAIRRAARILAEYVSPDYGLVRLEIGVERIY